MPEKSVKILASSVGFASSVHHSGEVISIDEAIAKSWVENDLAVYVETPEDKQPDLGTPEDKQPDLETPEDKQPDSETPEDKQPELETPEGDVPSVETASDKPAEETKPKTKRIPKGSK